MVFDLNTFLTLHGFPVQYLWVIPVALIVLGPFMMFYGQRMWGIIIAIAGAVVGYYASAVYLIPHFSTYLGPQKYLWELIATVLAGVLISISVRVGVSGGLGYAGYYIATHQHYLALSTYEGIGIAFAVFGIAYAGYGKLSIILAGSLGAAGMYFGLNQYVSPLYTLIIVGVFLTVGMIYQFRKTLFKKGARKVTAGVQAVGKEARATARMIKRKAKYELKLARLREKSARVRVAKKKLLEAPKDAVK